MAVTVQGAGRPVFLAPLWLNAAPRVITLSPANTELAFAAGITPVGVSSYSDYPPQAQRLGRFPPQGMNLERIVALKPDLVIARRGGNAERQVDQLASLGIKVMWVDATSIEQIANALRQLAPGVRNRIRPNKPRNPCWISTRN